MTRYDYGTVLFASLSLCAETSVYVVHILRAPISLSLSLSNILVCSVDDYEAAVICNAVSLFRT